MKSEITKKQLKNLDFYWYYFPNLIGYFTKLGDIPLGIGPW